MAFQYDKREVSHGNQFGFFAKISSTPTGEIEFGTPYEFTGLRATSFATTQDSNPYYADNVEHVRLMGARTTEGSITTYQIKKQFMIDHLGKKETTATPPALIDTGIQSNFVWVYSETITDQFGGELNEWHIWTNVQASAGITSDTATDEDSVEPKEIEIPVTASPNVAVQDSDGKSVTEIIWRDDSTGTVKALVDSLFSGTTPLSIAEFLDKALGKTV